MSAEALDQQPAQNRPESQIIEELVLSILEQHNGLCLDNEEERMILATVLATALMGIDSGYVRKGVTFEYLQFQPSFI